MCVYVEFGKFDFKIDMYQTDKYISSYSNFPVKVHVGERIFLQVKLRSNNTDLLLFVDNCKATPTVDPNDPSAYPLIKDGYGMLRSFIHALHAPTDGRGEGEGGGGINSCRNGWVVRWLFWKWLVGVVGWLVGWLVCWLVWLVWLVSWMIVWFGWLFGWLIDWLVD